MIRRKGGEALKGRGFCFTAKENCQEGGSGKANSILHAATLLALKLLRNEVRGPHVLPQRYGARNIQCPTEVLDQSQQVFEYLGRLRRGSR